jgi:hypothetical protein
MALPWPHGTPTLPRPVRAVSATAAPTAERERTTGSRPALLTRIEAVVTAPTTALVVMLLGLALLFVLPLVGLPFVAVVVLPAVIYHLGAERRTALRRTR